MPKPAREVQSGLEGKGFVAAQSNHIRLHLYVGGKKTIISTKISHGAREIPDNLLAAMARQVRLSRREFLDLIECPLSQREYEDRLRAAEHIRTAPVSPADRTPGSGQAGT